MPTTYHRARLPKLPHPKKKGKEQITGQRNSVTKGRTIRTTEAHERSSACRKKGKEAEIMGAGRQSKRRNQGLRRTKIRKGKGKISKSEQEGEFTAGVIRERRGQPQAKMGV